MSDLVEKVARAIFTELGWGDGDEDFDWRHLEGEAKAAIATVLREMMKKQTSIGLMPSIIRGGLLEFAEHNGIEMDWGKE